VQYSEIQIKLSYEVYIICKNIIFNLLIHFTKQQGSSSVRGAFRQSVSLSWQATLCRSADQT